MPQNISFYEGRCCQAPLVKSTIPALDCESLAACLVRPGRKTSNDLLSVLATPGQTPHPVFALRRFRQALGKAPLLLSLAK